MCGRDRAGVLLYAHRGSSGPLAPDLVENTVPAVSTCLRLGADGVEVDLRLSRDGVLVVCHDRDLRRVAGSALSIADTTWPDLRSACARAGVALARAEDLLQAVGGRPVVLELKRPQVELVGPTVSAVVTLLAARRAAGLPQDVTVSSFSPGLVRGVRRAAPAGTVRTALLGRPQDRPTGLLRRALEAGHDEVHPHVTALLADPSCVGSAHAVGVRVVPYTVNRGRALRRLARLGVDAVITDVPVSARLALAAAPAPA
jgi:glycerophosphoryl diester phosphodiesterase